MHDSLSYKRLAVVVVAAFTCWFCSTLVPSPYKKDAALVPMPADHQVAVPEPLSGLSPLPVALLA